MDIKQEVLKYARLMGKVFISPKSNSAINAPGAVISYPDEQSVFVKVKIGDSHTATLSMTIDAYNALSAGQRAEVVTYKEFQGKYIKSSSVRTRED